MAIETMKDLLMRDWFAGQAMASILVCPVGGETLSDGTFGEIVARRAYGFADAMLAERAKAIAQEDDPVEVERRRMLARQAGTQCAVCNRPWLDYENGWEARRKAGGNRNWFCPEHVPTAVTV